VHPSSPNKKIFSRDLLEVEVYNENRTKKLFTIYNNHLKSNYVPYGVDPVAGRQEADRRRKLQTETVAKIVDDQMLPKSNYIVLGDMNDSPDSDSLKPIMNASPTKLINVLLDLQPQHGRIDIKNQVNRLDMSCTIKSGLALLLKITLKVHGLIDVETMVGMVVIMIRPGLNWNFNEDYNR
jgi:hypothetical protein